MPSEAMFQSSQGEEVGYGIIIALVSAAVPVSVLSRRGSGLRDSVAVRDEIAPISFSPLKARKWAAGPLRTSTQLTLVVSVLSRRGSGLRVQVAR